MKRILYFLITATVITTIVGCQYKDFDEDVVPGQSLPVTLHFDWQNVDSVPGAMRVIFYNGNTLARRIDVGNRDTTLNISAGTYNIVTWNNDIPHVNTNDEEHRNNANASSLEYAGLNDPNIKTVLDTLFPGERIMDYPDYMVHTYKSTVDIDHRGQVITLIPDSMVVTVDVNIGGVAGLDIVTNLKGAISNVAGRRYMTYQNRTTDPATVIFDTKIHPQDSLITARFWVFGLEPEELKGTDHKAALFFWTKAGRCYVMFDISEDIWRLDENSNKLSINKPNIDVNLHDMLKSTSGFNLDISDWNNDFIGIDF